MEIKRIINQSFIIVLMALIIQSCSKSDNESDVIVKEERLANITSEKDGYTINIINQNLLNTEIIADLIKTFHSVYPKMVETYRPTASKSVKVEIDKDYDGVAYATNKIVISQKYLKGSPRDTDLLTHELMHLVQKYAGGAPGWLTEGIADYVRDDIGIANSFAGWRLPNRTPSQKYTDSYGVTARFLKWIKNAHDELIIVKVNKALHEGNYSTSIWKESTGYKLDDLWLLYSGKEIVPSNDWTTTASVKVSKENPNGANADEGSLKVIDDNGNSKFLIFDYPTNFWIQQDLAESKIVNKYTLTSGNDAAGRDPKSWKLSGSNDESTWIDLDTKTDETFSSRNETKGYAFESTTAYKYFRLAITENAGDTIFQLSEWRLIEVE